MVKWWSDNQWLSMREDTDGSVKYNRPNETLKAWLPSFTTSDTLCVHVWVRFYPYVCVSVAYRNIHEALSQRGTELGEDNSTCILLHAFIVSSIGYIKDTGPVFKIFIGRTSWNRIRFSSVFSHWDASLQWICSENAFNYRTHTHTQSNSAIHLCTYLCVDERGGGWGAFQL